MDGPRNLAISTFCLRPGKWLKGESKTLRHGEESLLLENVPSFVTIFKDNLTGWNYSATAEPVIYKCRKVQV